MQFLDEVLKSSRQPKRRRNRKNFEDSDSDGDFEFRNTSFNQLDSSDEEYGVSNGCMAKTYVASSANGRTSFVAGQVLNATDGDAEESEAVQYERKSSLDADDLVNRIIEIDGVQDDDEEEEKGDHNDANGLDRMDSYRGKFLSKYPPGDNLTGSLSSDKMEKLYGKGLKMLQKMGYKGGGLGKDGSGTVAPIQVKARVKQKGLQDQGEMVKVNLTQLEHLNQKARQKMSAAYSTAWRRTPASGEESTNYNDIILSSNDDLDRLLNDFQMRCNLFDDSMRQLSRDLRNAEIAIEDIRQNLQCLESLEKREACLIAACDTIANEVIDLCSDFDAKLDVESQRQHLDSRSVVAHIDKMLKSTLEIFKREPEAYNALQLNKVLIAQLQRGLTLMFGGWDPKEDPCKAKDVLETLLVQYRDPMIINNVVTVLEDTCVNVLRQYFLKTWDILDTDFGLFLYETWSQVLAQYHEALVEGINEILEFRFKEFIEDADTCHVAHVMIHPWLSIFGNDKVQTLCNSIVRVLQDMISEDADKNKECFSAMLTAWNPLFTPSLIESLNAHVCATLASSLSKVVVNPRNQDTSVIEALFFWIDIVGLDKIAKVFTREFFPKWIQSLKTWTKSPNPDFEQIIIWYQGWKSLFPPQLVQLPTVEEFFKDALAIMGRACNEDPDADARASDANKAYATTQAEGSSTSLLEKLGALSQERGILMQPRVGHFHGGYKVYIFGSASIVVREDQVLMLERGKYSVVSLNELLSIATSTLQMDL